MDSFDYTYALQNMVYNPNNKYMLEWLDYIRSDKISAIKMFRLATGMGLKEAKDTCEAIAEGVGNSYYNPQKNVIERLQREIVELEQKVSDLKRYNGKMLELMDKNQLITLLENM